MAFYPGYNPWNAWDGDYALSADYRSITIPATPTSPILSPWHDTGSTLAKVSFSGTSTGTILAKTSASAPDTRNSALFQPNDSEWSRRFDATLGSPTTQGFSAAGSVSNSAATGGRRINGTGYYSSNPDSFVHNTDIDIERIGVLINAAHGGEFEVYFFDGVNRYGIQILGSLYTSSPYAVNAGNGNIFTATTGVWYDFIRVTYRTGTTVTSTRIYYRLRGTNSRTDLNGFIDAGAAGYIVSAANALVFGCVTGNGCDVVVDHLGVFQGSEWFTMTNSQTSFTNNRRYWQFKGGTLANGTLTEFDILSDLSAPSDIGSVVSNAIGTNAISSVCSSVVGANGYEFELIDAATSGLITTQDQYSVGGIFTGVADGSYKVRVKSFTDDGVRSANATLSSTITLPYVSPTPLVAITVSPTSIGSGQTATLNWSSLNGVLVSVNGSSVAASGSQSVVSWNPETFTFDMSVDNSTLTAGQNATLTWVSSGTVVDVLLNGSPVADSGSQVVSTGSSATVTAPNQPTLVNVINGPDRPIFIGVF